MLLSDRSLVIRAAVHDVQFTMMLTISLVVIVIFLFLRTLWATIIPSMAVPLSLLATLAVMYAVGYSLDNISLMALTISVGFVVDDAIVMIENIVRYIEQGKRPFEAALKGAGQIGFTIISITFSLIAVFIPLLFMGGIIGRLFREFAVTVSVAVVASAAISLTLTPVLCSLFLKEQGHQTPGHLNRALEGGFDWMLRVYDRGLGFVFRHQLPTLLSTLALIFVTGYLYVIIPKGFFPEQDTGFIFGQADTREDTSFLAMADLTHQIVDIVRKDPDVSGILSFTGASAYNPTENTARVFIQLKPHDQRNSTSNQIIQRLRPKVAAVQGIKFYMQSGQDISVGGRLSRTLYQYTLTDTDQEEINHWAPIIERGMKKLPELQDVASDQQVAAPHIAIEIDRDAASRMGISPSLIDQTLYDAFGQRQVANMYTSTSQYKVILEVQPQFQRDPTALSKIFIAGPNGAQIPLSAFAHFTSKVESLSINHQGQFPGGDLVVQSGAGRGARSGGRQDPGADDRPPRAGDARRLVPGYGACLPGFAVVDAASCRRGNSRRLHRPRRALRKLYPPDHDFVGVAVGRCRRVIGIDAAALRSERDRDDRRHPADRHRQEERDHDDRLCSPGGADRGQEPARGDPSGLPVALPADHDDDLCGIVRQSADRARPRAPARNCAGRSVSPSSAGWLSRNG